MHHLTLNVVHAVSPAGCEPNDLPKRATLPLKASAQEEKTKGKVGKTNKVAPPQKYAANMEGLSLDELNDAPAHIAANSLDYRNVIIQSQASTFLEHLFHRRA